MTNAAPSRPVRITFFEDRAEVVRRSTVASAEGKGWVVIDGVTPLVDDRSLRVAPVAADSVKVLAARVVRDMRSVPSETPEAVAALEGEVKAARRAHDASKRKLQRVARRRERVEAQVESWSEGIARAPEAIDGQEDAAVGWRAAYDALQAEDRAALAAQEDARVVERECSRQVIHLEERLAQARSLTPRWRASVEVQLDATAGGDVELEVIYRTPCALWRPEHHAVLETDSGEAPDGTLTLTTLATAWQRTGESWENVEVVFSTARPGQAANAPEVRDDRLHTRTKTDEERKQVVVEARDQEVKAVGGSGTRTVEEMPGVDDGGEPLSFSPEQPVTIASDGEPLRVEIAAASLAAKVDLLLLPERSQAAHLRAKATHGGNAPLLAGPIRLLRQTGVNVTAVGRGKLDFVAVGEPFEIGFGPDDAIRVQRNEKQERSTTPLIGTQHVSREVTVFLSNLSTDVKRVHVKERIPVSEIEDLTVTLSDAKTWTRDTADGFLSRELELAPRDTQTLTYGYALKASSKVVLP